MTCLAHLYVEFMIVKRASKGPELTMRNSMWLPVDGMWQRYKSVPG